MFGIGNHNNFSFCKVSMTLVALFQGAFTTTSTMSFAMAILNCSLGTSIKFTPYLLSAMVDALELVLYEIIASMFMTISFFLHEYGISHGHLSWPLFCILQQSSRWLPWCEQT
jgi:hypothetical protein